MISFAAPMPVGNAVKIVLAPDQAAAKWRILRKKTNDISGPSDPTALVVYDGNSEVMLIDFSDLENGTPYYYASYEYVDEAWVVNPVLTLTPATNYSLVGSDPLSLIRDRLEAGLRAAVAANQVKHPNGFVPVLTAPPLFENTKFPIVSCHLEDDAPGERAIGEMSGADVFNPGIGDDVDSWQESEGWLANTSIQIIVWALNPDERIALRKVVKGVMLANLPVFNAAGFVRVSFAQRDIEDFESYNAPVYQTMGNFSCLAPAAVAATVPAIVEVDVTATSTQDGP